MNNITEREFEKKLREIAAEYPYPVAPDISKEFLEFVQNSKKRNSLYPQSNGNLKLSTLIVVLSLAFLITLSVPSVRAQILELLQIGSIRIFPTETLMTEPLKYNSFPSLDDLSGETTLEQVQADSSFLIPLPKYPPDLGPPDRVFLQDLEGEAVLLVWLTSDNPDQILFNLLILGPETLVDKTSPEIISYTQVNDQPAVWTQGHHFLQINGIFYQTVPLSVEGNILIWQKDHITYRLESDFSMEEAVRIAESLE